MQFLIIVVMWSNYPKNKQGLSLETRSDGQNCPAPKPTITSGRPQTDKEALALLQLFSWTDVLLAVTIV